MSQAGAERERILANSVDTVRDGNAGQAGAPRERLTANGGDRVAFDGIRNNQVGFTAGVTGDRYRIVGNGIFPIYTKSAV